MRVPGRSSRARLLRSTRALTAFGGGVVLMLLTVSVATANVPDPATTPSVTNNGNCPASNPPNELVLAGGSPQTAQLEAAFANPLQVTLANTNGCPVTGVIGTPITFSSPVAGAGGRFEASGTGTQTVGADSQGSAQAGTFTANDTPGSYTVTATSAYGTVGLALTNSAFGIPAKIGALGSTSQSATIDARYRRRLSVLVTDANGEPVIDATVIFSLHDATTGSGSGSAAAGASFAGGSVQVSESTNSAGVATSPSLSADDTPGTFMATASVAHLTMLASFRLRNLAGRPLRLRAVGSTQRAATVDSDYQRPLQVQLTRANNHPVEGATVNFTLISPGSGSGANAAATFNIGATQTTETTGANGIATSPHFAANSVAGTLRAIVTLQGTSATVRFQLHNTTARLRVLGSTQRTATVDTGYQHPLQVRVAGAGNKPIEGATVTFTLNSTASTAGPSAAATFNTGTTQATETTGANGIATSPHFAANSVSGTLRAIVTLQETSTSVQFALQNKAGTPMQLTAGAAANESTSTAHDFPIPLAVTVTDAHDNPVPDAPVTFTAPRGGASGNFQGRRRRVTVRADARGVAVAPPFIADDLAGGYIVRATAREARPAAFALVNQQL